MPRGLSILSSLYQAEKWAHIPCPLLGVERQESHYRVSSGLLGDRQVAFWDLREGLSQALAKG